jgi:PAS domain-containing protein
MVDLVGFEPTTSSMPWKRFRFEHRLLMPGGSVKYVRVVAHAITDESGSIEFVGALTDITAAKQAEDKIRQSESELRQILDCAPKWVAVLGPDRSPLYANQSVLDYFGFTLDEWRGAERHKYYHPDDWEHLTSETHSKFLSGLPHEYEARFLGKSNMPYQRGQFWVRRFQQQTVTLCVALVSLTTVVPATDFLTRALQMLEGIGWIVAHRFLFAELRAHLLGWPRFLVPHGCRLNLLPASSSS